MKKLSIILLSSFLLTLSCRKPEDVPAPSSVISGKNWKLIYYSFNGTDITGDFGNCVLSFGSNGNLKITKDEVDYNGSWVEFSEPPKLDINIISSDPYVDQLSGNWENKLLNPGRIELVDDKIAPQKIVKLDLIP